jgi:hypothetical protein
LFDITSLNRGYVGVATFDRNYRKNQYDSFVLGNSRSFPYEIDDWKNYIDANSSCFHFDGADESLYGIDKKVNYIKQKKLSLRNVLLILDYSTLDQVKSSTEHLKMLPPQLEQYKNGIAFHGAFAKVFINPRFAQIYFTYRITGEIKPYTKEEQLGLKYDPQRNEVIYSLYEQMIQEDQYYFNRRMKKFYPRDTIQHYSPVVIKERQKELLTDILKIFKEDKTNYKVIINPLYDQKKLNPVDLNYLKEIFGQQNVFDFSGINEFTQDYHNYYDVSHYRPTVSRQILRIINQDLVYGRSH